MNASNIPSSLQRLARVVVQCAVLGAILSGAEACHRADAITSTFDPGTFFQTLSLTEHAITLSTVSPQNTVRLHVAATLGTGTTVPAAVTYSASDTTITVDTTGLVKARFATVVPSYVRVTVSYLGVTRRDSAAIEVLDGAIPGSITGIHLQIPSGVSPNIPLWYYDSTIADIRPGIVALAPVAIGSSGESYPEVLFALSSDDSAIAKITSDGIVTAVRPGAVMMRATASIFGTTFNDSVLVRVGASRYFSFGFADSTSPGTTARGIFAPDTGRVSVGAMVFWSNYTTAGADVVFDDTTGIDSVSFDPLDGALPTGNGNIAPFGGPYAPDPTTVDFLTFYLAVNRARLFNRVGVYHFHSTIAPGAHGVLIVCPLTDPCYPK